MAAGEADPRAHGILRKGRADQIPPISAKNNREAFLQNFLNSCIERKEIRNSSLMQDFLFVQDLKSIYKSTVNQVDSQEAKGKSISTLHKELFGDGLGEKPNSIFHKLFEKRQHRIVTTINYRMG